MQTPKPNGRGKVVQVALCLLTMALLIICVIRRSHITPSTAYPSDAALRPAASVTPTPLFSTQSVAAEPTPTTAAPSVFLANALRRRQPSQLSDSESAEIRVAEQLRMADADLKILKLLLQVTNLSDSAAAEAAAQRGIVLLPPQVSEDRETSSRVLITTPPASSP